TLGNAVGDRPSPQVLGRWTREPTGRPRMSVRLAGDRGRRGRARRDQRGASASSARLLRFRRRGEAEAARQMPSHRRRATLIEFWVGPSARAALLGSRPSRLARSKKRPSHVASGGAARRVEGHVLADAGFIFGVIATVLAMREHRPTVAFVHVSLAVARALRLGYSVVS